MYGTNMGTPPMQAADDDDFDDSDIDDEEMLDVAEDIENFEKTNTLNWNQGPRDVFQETTGNRLAQRQRPVPKKTATSIASGLPASSAHPQYQWSRDVKAVLKDRFHLRGFRPNQLEAINATLAGKDCFVLMPTGGGKSLCYQLPSVIYSGKTRGVTVVISPLLSLMTDQVAHMKNLRIQAMSFNGETSATERRCIMDGLRESHVEKFIQLLYVAPEMLSKSATMVSALQALHQRQRLARIVIDEAHCVSQWGHDFRPDYKLLGNLRRQFVGVPVMALTATATENVKVDTIHNLGIRGCEVFAQSFNRPNLYYEIRQKSKGTDVLEDIAMTINSQYAGQSGIVYCLSRKKCELIAKNLKQRFNVKAQHYHAGMSPSERSETQRSWQTGKCDVIVATIAFGMGIDKPDVRFVIHHSIPKSLEGYYQETGRAGRDGKRSGCFLYYGYQDTNTLKWMIDKGEGEKLQKDRQYAMLRNVVQYCENKSDCRRAQVLAYFNEQFKPEDCNNTCDNCNSSSTFEPRDFTEDAIAAISLVRKIHEQQVTILHCADVFRGGKSKKITDLHHNSLDEYRAGSHLERGEAERLFNRLVSEDALKEYNVLNGAGFASQYIKPGKYADEFGSGRRRLIIHVRASPNSKSTKGKAAPKKKAQTGVAAACGGLPLSTNVSSPIQAAARRRKIQSYRLDNQDALHANGYESDEFVANGEENSDDDSDDFEPIRTTSKRKRATVQKLGPPITIDEKMDGLTELHREVVENFVREARRECENVMMAKNLRAHPFTDTMLREMAISFPASLDDMLAIPNINAEMVKHYGKRFLKLIEKASVFYASMMEEQDGQRAPMDPNREIVEISDDDDGNDGGDDFDLDLSPQDVRSSYFQQEDDPDVTAFNAKFEQWQDAAHTSQKARAVSPKNQRGKFGNSSKNFSRKHSRRSSGGFSKGRSNSGVTKKTTSKKRESGNGFKFKPKRGGGGGGGATGGIGMMPI
ncbi:uncharacterized protein K452DRAFT_223123 [Aplosporella prunicola CBS 121167]|uniref:ATP-dependent DNA helicase n=1 Tax=Aplosporella prunicola CBS 121167 TaxID=1176127 RepID=A0A6A6BKP3_9PEZI|nr:uncharacterized protein K452DRAFT_223123 [Aplosporella prunicola CBS 121167]KAF2144679.1 hypothetical protein K452DRAFT_223123 [Aplosporella prunicola CBS 121167]